MKRLSTHSMLKSASVLLAMLTAGFFCQDALGFKEAPMLAEIVKAGKLPPVEQRLPASPVVLKPVEKPGVYGGAWRRAYTGMADLVGIQRILYEPLIRWSPDYKLAPNLAERWDVDESSKVFTFHLVKGVRWSDGQPFTADDILFYFEDILEDKELTSSIPSWLAPGGKPPKVSKLDDYTIRFEFEKPYGLFLDQLACPEGMELVTKPKHYLKRFHKKYAKPEELEALMKEKKASSWVKLFEDAAGMKEALFLQTGFPSLGAWITKVPAPAKRFILERNPYYWKVDTEGKQLPYIDSMVNELLAESQTILLKAIAGEIDMQGRGIGGMQNSVLLLARVGEGKFKLVPKKSTASVAILLAPNLNHPDPMMRQILSDPRFRKALSHGTNRDEINKIVFRSKGVPRQAAPLKESGFYSESYEKAYLDYSTDKAKALLDEMGLKIGPGGKRMRPDGQPLRLTLDVMVVIQPRVDAAEIMASNFGNLGIDTEVKAETRELFRQRVQTCVHDIAIWSGDGGMECLLDPRWYFPYSSESYQAPLYAKWFQTGGKSGEEPPPVIKGLMETFTKIAQTVSEEKRKELFKQIIAANEENLWVIGVVYPPPDYYVVSVNMHNVPTRDFEGWKYPNPGPIHPEQFFLTKK